MLVLLRSVRIGDRNGVGGFYVGIFFLLTLGSGNVVGFEDIGLAIPLDMLRSGKIEGCVDIW